MSYTGQVTIQEEPETSDNREIQKNYIVFTGSIITLVTNRLDEEEQVDEEAIQVLDNKNYQSVLTPVSL
ncbi:MAG: hypothetical protein ACREGI_03305 [Candidatus Levyibacteriota bacterium]